MTSPDRSDKRPCFGLAHLLGFGFELITLAMTAFAYLTAIHAHEAEKGEVRTVEKNSYR